MTANGSTTFTLRPSGITAEDQQGPDGSGLLELLEEAHCVETRCGRPKTAIVGLGYVGLPTALALASSRYGVVGIDIDPGRLEGIRRRKVDLLPGESLRLALALDNSYLELTDSPEAIADVDSIVISVPTPVDEHLVPDLSFVESACRTVVSHARRGQTVILTSTSYVGTTRDMLVRPLVARGFTPGTDIFIAFSPERIDPGNADRPQSSVPRVVGGATPRCTLRALGTLGQMTSLIHSVSSIEAAEFTKLYENTFRAVNIAFANEMAEMGRVLGLDVMEVITAASTKPYGFMPFYPGAGVGGHCIPCDPHYLLWQMRAARHQSPLVEKAMSGIAARPGRVVERAAEMLATKGRPVDGSRVLIVGVSYKPGVEDVRGSPAIEVLESLRGRGACVRYQDALVPELRLRDGSVLRSTVDPVSAAFDLVIVHGVHPGFDLRSIEACALVLDTTYKLTAPAHRAVL